MIKKDNLKIVSISPYYPKECGIASYATDLVTSYRSLGSNDKIDVFALTEKSEHYQYPQEVKETIPYDNLSAYLNVAKILNDSCYDLIHIQHEFGLYGGDDGSFILNLVENLKKPYAVTFHTILSDPNPEKIKIIKELAQNAKAVIVMVDEAIARLRHVYNLSDDNFFRIAHGVPDIPPDGSELVKVKLGYSGRKIITTFGLISQNKGIEYMINALPDIIKVFPKVTYLIIGKTHPIVYRKEGEKYRLQLEKLVKDKNLQNHVQFVNKFLSQDELINYLRATDIYITPYLEPQQISSGALAYALGSGKVCISTPYAYAKEVLAKGRGFLVPFASSKEISRVVKQLFLYPLFEEKLSARSYAYGRRMIWSNIAKEHYDLFHCLV